MAEAKRAAAPLWGPVLLHLRAGRGSDAACLDAIPGLAWAGWVERRGGVHHVTPRGEAALKHLRRRRRWPSEEELNRALLDAPSLPGSTQGAHQGKASTLAHKQPRNLPEIARIVAEYGFRMERVFGDDGALKIFPWRGDGWGTLDFDEAGRLACCAWELSARREDRCRIMDLVDGVPEEELRRWLQWGRARARDLSREGVRHG